MKTNFYSKLLATAVIVAFFSSAFAGTVFIRNEANKKVIQTPHFYEYSNENPSGNGWCGHTALKSAMAAYGYEWDLQSIHKKALEIDPTGRKYGYYEWNPECQGTNYCAELNLLKDVASSFGFSTIRGNAYSQQ